MVEKLINEREFYSIKRISEFSINFNDAYPHRTEKSQDPLSQKINYKSEQKLIGIPFEYECQCKREITTVHIKSSVYFS